ncbi:MAG: Gfo/Idh/MocA family oxidoreductase [Tannerella sp.]|jgi:predicted dehydrogenase|nr:Gfo/Idh/MocA family oxidoreductase [Tannerella sp.]
MKYLFILAACPFVLLLASCSTKTGGADMSPGEVRLITLDPGHFHAALVQKISYPQVSPDVYVYAPEGNDLNEHLKRIDGYNTRTEDPAHWREIVYTGDDYLERMFAEKKGNVIVTAGNNGRKTAYIEQAIRNGIHVLADKPMAINIADFGKLEDCFRVAGEKGVLLYDIMTERYEIATILQRELSLLPDVYGEQTAGSAEEPAVVMESVHHFLKTVSGNPLLRPAWFFDTKQQGEGIADVAVHLVDLVQWELFPEQVIDYRRDIELLDASHWSTSLTAAQFAEVTGQAVYPPALAKDVHGDTLKVYANGDILYRIKGVHAKVSVVWNYSFPEGGGDTHYSIMKGSKAHLVIEQGKEQGYRPALYIHAVNAGDTEAYGKALQSALSVLQSKHPGVDIREMGTGRWEVTIPDAYHNGHEAHFGQVTEHFLQYLEDGSLPQWEVPGMIAKYYVTTRAVEMAGAKNR